MSSPADRVRDALTAPLAAIGVDLEDLEIERAGRRHVVRVIVDQDGGVDLDKVAEVSRAVSDVLDAPEMGEVLPGPFVLEVSSPGVDRPLTEERHWRRAIGRLVQAELADGTARTGRIVLVEGDVVTLAGEGGDLTLSRGDVRRAVVQVEFTRVETDEPAQEEAGQ